MRDRYLKSDTEAQKHFLRVVKAKKIVNDTLDRNNLQIDALELAFWCGTCGPTLPLVRVSSQMLKCINCGRRMKISVEPLPPS